MRVLVSKSVGERLSDGRAELIALLDEMDGLVGRSTLDAGALARVRWTMARALFAVALMKQRELFAPALASAMPARSTAAARLAAQSDALVASWRDYVTRWAGGIGDREDAYRAEARRLGAALREQLDREARELGALLP